MPDPIRYRIVAKDPAAHLFEVTLQVTKPAPQGQLLVLPAWIPGSYMIREFARHIVRIRAEAKGRRLALKKLDKHSWQAAPCSGVLTVTYEVYAWDLSVRAAHLDRQHGFFNGTSVFLRVEGQEYLPHRVDIMRPEGKDYKTWRVATTLPELKARRYGFGSYRAANYDELIDHPVEMGDFVLASFKAHGVPHDIVFTGVVPNLDLERVTEDLSKLCKAQIALFEPRSKRAPMARYLFQVMVVGDGYGGLEHRSSTALICARADLPVKGRKETSDGYRSFLGLCSHEYFHTWNVKRIKPAAFVPYDLQAENHTPLLWLFEGFTSYYDDLMLARTGLITPQDYLGLLAKNANGVMRGSGRFKQSVAESSFDAWSKYYRQDENAPNAIVSYYGKGALVGLAIDLTLRTQSRGALSLDDIMRELWQRHGRDFYEKRDPGGVEDGELETLLQERTGHNWKPFFERYVRGTADLPLADLLKPFGVKLEDQRNKVLPVLGARTSRQGSDCTLANVYEGGAAHLAGLSAGDVLVALDGLRVNATNLDTLLTRYRVGDRVTVHAFRRDELRVAELVLAAEQAPQWKATLLDKPVSALRLRAGWLGGKA